MNKFLLGVSLLLASFAQNTHAVTLSDLLKNNKLEQGFVGFAYDQKSGKTYLKITNLGSEFIYQSSLPNGLGSNDVGLDRGQLGDTRLVVFERVANKLFLKQKPVNFRADTDNGLEAEAVEQAFASSILWGFVVEDSGENWVLVDASDFMLQDIHGVGRTLEKQKQGKDYIVDASRSAIDLAHTKAFPDNTELQAVITLVGSEPGNFVRDTAPNPYAVTFKMRHSFIRLPEDGYQTRTYIPKSGYWTTQYQDYAQAINSKITQQLIGRHRLIKKDPSALMSEAEQPIVYHVDPGVPEPVRSALIDGASWWNSAFEGIGFKDAFQVKLLPDGADPMDVRYNVIQWVHRATRGWSYGYGVTDPRTGEIIKGHVTLGSLRVRQDYLIAQGMMAPFATDENDQALMDLALARIRQLSAHEVGHTIGLAHNFAASAYGRASVMDYPHPQFEIDPNNANKVVAPEAYGTGLGKWDKAAIAYGYQQFVGEDGQVLNNEQEISALRLMIDVNDINGLLYISDADARSPGSAHADASLWDNGADAVEELKKVMQLRRVAMQNFGAANLQKGRNWSDLEEIFVPVYYFHRYQTQAAAKWLGGVRYDYGVKGLAGNGKPTLETVSAEQQLEAMAVMLNTLKPSFLQVSPDVLSLMVPKATQNVRTRESLNGDTGVTFDQLALAAAAAQHSLSLMLNPQRLARLIQQNASNRAVPSINDLGKELHQAIIDQSYTGIQASIHQSVVDLIYSNYLNLLRDKKVSQPVKMQVLGLLSQAKRYLQRKAAKGDKVSGYYGFYQYQLTRLENLSAGEEDRLMVLPMMPPGSPI